MPRTLIVSDLHLASGSGADLLSRPAFRRRLVAQLEGIDRLVLLGDIVELRDRRLDEALALSRPALAEIASAAGEAEIVLVPGNHDHHLLAGWLERRRLDGAGPLGLEERVAPVDGLAGALAASLGGDRVGIAYPGLWVRDDVYATHGHYLDRHLTIPTFERLGVGLVERILGLPAQAPGGDSLLTDPDSYERVQAPVYEFLYALAQAGGRTSGNPSARVWQAVSGGGASRAARLRGWLLGSVALPGAVGVANRLGLGPVGADLSVGAITAAQVAAIGEVVERLGIEAAHVIFGHTHRRGPLPSDGPWIAARETLLHNAGSWVHSPDLLGKTAASSPYWPGTVAIVDDAGPPELRHLLDDLTREELTGA